MLGRINRLRSQSPPAGERGVSMVQGVTVALAALIFVVGATFIIAFDRIVPGRTAVSSLEVGDITPQDIRAPFDWRYESSVLTERRQQEAMAATAPIFDPPDPNVARQQIQLTRQILDYIDNVRHDPFFGTLDQHIEDIQQISALVLDRPVIEYILSLSDDQWRALDTEITSVLERVMREEIRETNLPVLRNQLPMQVSVRFIDNDVRAITAIVEDLIRPNTFPNPDATEAARQAAAASIAPETRVFERGQIVIRVGARIEPVDYEALGQLGLLQTDDRRYQEIIRAFLASVVVLVVTSLYLTRLKIRLFADVRLMFMLEALFLIVLMGARIFSPENQIYIYPTAALALLLVALNGPMLATIAVIDLAVLIGLMVNKSLEVSLLVLVGGLVGTLTLRREERLNSFFISGIVVALANILIVTIFNLEMLAAGEGSEFGLLVLYSLVNGIFAAAVALAAMYVVTLLFNLPTSLKLVELSQPNQPLLQRLLREAPGTYQHSLQVANLSEQAANAVGANAEQVRVASLYHDIGKMLNPAFFIENQVENVNPHDSLGDPYRSADIIISHVIDGDRLARQYRLPLRIRDFINEHHGTTLVSYFYRQALNQAEDPEAVDIDQFTYRGPKPQTRETAIMMLADSCESTVRARKPSNRQEISDIVQQMIDLRIREGQLDESGLTTNDLKTVRNIFIEMLQAVFHPRINYPTLPAVPERHLDIAPEAAGRDLLEAGSALEDGPLPRGETPPALPELPAPRATPEIQVRPADDDQPLPEVPPLRRTTTTTMRPVQAEENGSRANGDQHPAEEPADNRAND